MGSLFYLVLNMSLTAAAIGLIVALLRLLLGNRPPALARYALWGFVLLRLLLPFSVPSGASFMNPVGVYVTRIASYPVGDSRMTMTNSIGLVENESDSTVTDSGAANWFFPQAVRFRSKAFASAFHTLGLVWLAGASLAILTAAALYLLAALRFRRAVPVRDGGLAGECAALLGVRRKIGLFATDAVSSPVVFGVFRPRVFIPPALLGDTRALRYALLHELVHIRRGDPTFRVVSFLVLCVYWFNPLMWLFFRLAGRDMELACDAGVLRHLDRAGRKEYALALLGLAEGRQPVLAAAFGSSALRQRISGIAKYRGVTVAAAAAVLLLLLALAAVLLTNPVV